MKDIEIEFKASPTGSYSPWHLEIIEENKLNLICTDDIAYFVKIDNEIFKIQDYIVMRKLQDVVSAIAEKNKAGELSDEKAAKEIHLIFSDINPNLQKQSTTEEFKQQFNIK